VNTSRGSYKKNIFAGREGYMSFRTIKRASAAVAVEYPLTINSMHVS
jgi:hypothetical protein